MHVRGKLKRKTNKQQNKHHKSGKYILYLCIAFMSWSEHSDTHKTFWESEYLMPTFPLKILNRPNVTIHKYTFCPWYYHSPRHDSNAIACGYWGLCACIDSMCALSVGKMHFLRHIFRFFFGWIWRLRFFLLLFESKLVLLCFTVYIFQFSMFASVQCMRFGGRFTYAVRTCITVPCSYILCTACALCTHLKRYKFS